MTVYLLWHENDGDEKLLGVFSSYIVAKRAQKMYLNLPGFRDVPDGFIIDAYDVDERDWIEGYVK